ATEAVAGRRAPCHQPGARLGNRGPGGGVLQPEPSDERDPPAGRCNSRRLPEVVWLKLLIWPFAPCRRRRFRPEETSHSASTDWSPACSEPCCLAPLP